MPLDNAGETTSWFVAARALHFGACLLIFGLFLFDRFIVPPVARQSGAGAGAGDGIGGHWRPVLRNLTLAALPAALVSGACWFGLISIRMSGLPPRDALAAQTLRLVWDQTHFGALWKLRAALWLGTSAAAVAALASRRASPAGTTWAWVTLALGGLLVTSLAWAGHGRTCGCGLMRWHLAADVLHLAASAAWPTGLLPFALMLFKLRQGAGEKGSPATSLLTNRFSAWSLASVAALTATGVANSWFLLGPVSNLFTTSYGRVLLVKVAIFALLVGIGAVNLVRLKPRLSGGRGRGTDRTAEERAATRLQRNVAVELVLAAAVTAAVGLLGVLSPGQFDR